MLSVSFSVRASLSAWESHAGVGDVMSYEPADSDIFMSRTAGELLYFLLFSDYLMFRYVHRKLLRFLSMCTSM